MDLNNATLIKLPLEDMEYHADFSLELPHKKIGKFVSLEQIATDGFGPFLSMSRLVKGDSYQTLVGNMGGFLSFRK